MHLRETAVFIPWMNEIHTSDLILQAKHDVKT